MKKNTKLLIVAGPERELTRVGPDLQQFGHQTPPPSLTYRQIEKHQAQASGGLKGSVYRRPLGQCDCRYRGILV